MACGARQTASLASRHADQGCVCAAACSSSFVALNDAVTDMQRGRIDYALVGGSSAPFRPATTVAFNQLQCAAKNKDQMKKIEDEFQRLR